MVERYDDIVSYRYNEVTTDDKVNLLVFRFHLPLHARGSGAREAPYAHLAQRAAPG